MPTLARVRRLFVLALSLTAAASASYAQQLGQPTYGPTYPQQQAGTAPTPGAPGAYSAQPQPPAGGPIGPTTQLGPAPGQAPAGAQQVPPPPFQLTDVDLNFVRQVLQMWELESAKIKTYDAQFERLEYDAVFGPADAPMLRSTGRLSYSRPDKGSFKIEEIKRWEKDNPKDPDPKAPGKWEVKKEEIGEHWVCDGKAVYEYDHRQKQLKVMPLPEALRGEQIVNGPLPFLFGAKADQMLQRYWIRALQSDAASIRLEAYPRWQSDAANYMKCDVILDRKTMQPTALQVHLPGGQQRHAYVFQQPTVNGAFNNLFSSLFSAPRTPLGWTKVVIDDATAQPVAANPANPAQAAAPSETQRQ